MKVDYWSSTKKIQLKENSMEDSVDRNLKEDSKFDELWNFLMKQKKKKQKKRKEKYSNSKNFVSWTLSKISFSQIALKFATLYLFHPFLSRFFCIKFPTKNFIVCDIFSNQYPNLKAAEL